MNLVSFLPSMEGEGFLGLDPGHDIPDIGAMCVLAPISEWRP